MIDEYDFQMVKRAYAEMARRAGEEDRMRRPACDAGNASQPPKAAPADRSKAAAEAR